MAQANVIKASARAVGGKGTARAVRRTGNVPAVVYGGDDKAADTIQIDANELFKMIKKGRSDLIFFIIKNRSSFVWLCFRKTIKYVVDCLLL